MRNIKLTIEYDGTCFNGWQIQPNNQRTIQGEIETAAKKLFNKNIKLIGSGRTDSGVHALGQVANFKIKSSLGLERIKKAFNALLPADISILTAEEVLSSFHSQYSAKKKTYQYAVYLRKTPSVFYKNFSFHLPQKLNFRTIRDEAKALIGKKDFKSFMSSSPESRKAPNKKNTIREIYRLEVQKKGDFLYIKIEANGFLYKMVRNIVGTLLQLGSGPLPKGSIQKILKGKDRTLAGTTAKPHGLTLLEVAYS